MSRMFKSITKTWNVFVGCEFNCTYCNARKAALTRFKHLDRYKDGFKPHLVESELSRTFKPGEFVFVAYMGDISFAHQTEAYCILDRIRQFPDTRFLLCTKDPGCFHKWGLNLPDNVVIATTLETNREVIPSKAPIPIRRYAALKDYIHPHKMVSIEPVMDFDLFQLLDCMEILKPEIIEVGADNYHNDLPEPSPEKLESLLYHLRHICPNVIEKDGLERLRERSNNAKA